MMSDRTALVVYAPTEPASRARIWTEIAPDVRRRRAMEAASTHDADDLVDMMHGYCLLRGRRRSLTSQHTLDSYAQSTRALVAAWRHENLLAPSEDAGDRYASLLATHLAPKSVSVRLAGAQTLYAALVWSKAVRDNPFAGVRAMRDTTPASEHRHPYPPEAVAALLDHADSADRAVVLLCAHGGLRIAEALALEWRSVNLAGGYLSVVNGKGGKDRRVYLSASLTTALRALQPASGYVLQTWRGRGYRDATVIRRRIQHLCVASGVEYLGMHAFRHSAATRLLHESGNLALVAAHLGHASLDTASLYARADTRSLVAGVSNW